VVRGAIGGAVITIVFKGVPPIWQGFVIIRSHPSRLNNFGLRCLFPDIYGFSQLVYLMTDD
jgi:hypothetical protein